MQARTISALQCLVNRIGRAVLAGICVLGLAGCTGLFFQPQRPLLRTPAELGLAFDDLRFVTSDNVTLHGWYLPAVGAPKGTVLFLHGNAENISTHIGSVMWLPAEGFNVMLFDYRGYGQSAGVPTVDGVQRDIDAALRHLLARRDVDPARVALFGQSLGGALAGYYAARGPMRRAFRAVVLDSAFSSYRDIAREKLDLVWWTRWLKWPAGFSIDDEYSPIRVVHDIAPTPVLLMAGGRDGIVPASHAKRLFDAARAPKSMWVFPEAGHIESLRRPEARSRFVEYLEQALR